MPPSTSSLRGNPSGLFLRTVSKHLRAGLSQGQAIKAAVHENPKAHQLWLKEVNRA
jgi:hypothetical protein